MPARTIDRLLFVYDADSGRWGAFVDSAKKLLMVQGCALCSITHGLGGERADWKECRAELGVPVDYLHRDQIAGELARLVGGGLPCIVAEAGAERAVLIGPDTLRRCGGSVAELRGKLQYHARAKELRIPALGVV